uniref:Uncharacterized protein n=1 Tax=Physcomitrium patens TaxID=3218 RepID=A0A7I4E087_PHYPA
MLMMRTLLMKAPRHSYWMKTLLCTERGQSDLKRPCVFSLLCTRWQETCRKEYILTYCFRSPRSIRMHVVFLAQKEV